jgi:hypothetical protein
MRYTLAFGAVAAVMVGVMAAAAWMGGWAWAVVPGAAWIGLAFGGAASAYAGLGPRVFGKRADGAVPVWSYLLFGPFLLFGRAGLRAANAAGLGTPWDEVSDRLVLGRRPHPSDRHAFRRLGVVAVLDMAAEVARSRGIAGTEAYCALPVLDHAGPRGDQLDRAVAFIDLHRADGPVYVHCALGIGRGATVVLAWLLHAGRVGSVDEGVRFLARRRRVSLSPAQRRAVEAWWAAR